MPVFDMADTGIFVKSGDVYEPVCDVQSIKAEMSYEFKKSVPSGKEWGNCHIFGRWIELSFAGKRCVGSTGNDYIASRALCFKGAVEEIMLDFPDGQKLCIPGIICVVQPFGGAELCELSWRFISSGEPFFVEEEEK